LAQPTQPASQSATTGRGQMWPQQGAGHFNALQFMVEQVMAGNATAKVVQVKSVTGGGLSTPPRVSVQIMVNQYDGSGNSTPHGIINNVPVMRLQGGSNAVIIDPVVGDIGIMVCADRDISAVKATAKVSNAGSFRRFDPADGLYIGGVLNAAPLQYVWFTGDDGVKVADKNGNTVLMHDEGITLTDAQGSTVKMDGEGITLTPAVGKVKVVGDMQVTGQLTGSTDSGAVGLATHTHQQPNDSHGDTEEPTDPPTPGT
jgi:hypothetical protein